MGLLAVGSCKIGREVKYFLTPKGKKQDTAFKTRARPKSDSMKLSVQLLGLTVFCVPGA